jgi:formylglycine-generating enzyme required for sulfatase activity
MAHDPVVFISSTSEDLKEYREQAAKAALATGFSPRMMEYFPANGRIPSLSACLEMVAEAEVVIVIVAHRYGWVPEDPANTDAKSITWLECEHAWRVTKKEVLAFLVKPDYPWPLDLRGNYRLVTARDKPGIKREVKRNENKLAEFKANLEGFFVGYFTDAASLRTQVAVALAQRRSQHSTAADSPLDNSAKGDPLPYLSWLHERTATIDIRGLGGRSGKALNFPIEDLYIPLSTTERTDLSVIKTIDLKDALVHPRLVAVGDPGSGKTTFLRRVAYELSDAALERDAEPFPILINIASLMEHIALRHTDDRQMTLDSPDWLIHFMAAQSSKFRLGLGEAFFRRRLESGLAILLLDGLDEVSKRVDREQASQLFENATEAFRNCRFVVTSRPQGYQGRSLLRRFHEVRIAPLQPAAIEKFLEHWCRGLYPENAQMASEHQAELSGALRARPEIRRMARNPVMLTALAVVHWNEKRLPEQRAALYDSVLTWLSISRQMRPGREEAERCLDLLRELALAMQVHPDGRQKSVSAGWAAEVLKQEFADMPERDRFGRALAFLEEEAADSGIIVEREGEIEFWHLTFQEYMAAQAIKDLGDAELSELLLRDERIYRPEWREVALLLAGVVRGRQGRVRVDNLISAVLDQLGNNPTLTRQARAMGLLVAMVRDLRHQRFHPRDGRYQELLEAVLGIFDRQKSKTVDFGLRLETAESLGQAGDPRIANDNWVRLEGGTFLSGEPPRNQVILKAFEIGRYPVTVQEYKQFLQNDGCTNQRWWTAGGFGPETEPKGWEEQQEHPNRAVVGVSWFEAAAYCSWAGGRLPTDNEWEFAARGVEGREYPWGSEPPDGTRANYRESPVDSPTPVGLYPAGATPEGIHDLAGNVWEWIDGWYEKDRIRILRGGAWNEGPRLLRSAYRYKYVLGSWDIPGGFRCVRDVFSRLH